MESSLVRVAHVLHQYLPITENWVAPVVRGAAGVQSCVLSICRSTNLDAFPFEPIEAIEALDDGLLLEEARFLQRFGYMRRFRQVAERHGAQVVHAHFGDLGVRAIGLSRRLRVPLVTSFYGYDLSRLPTNPMWAAAYQALFAHGDAFLVEGSHARQCLLNLGCPPERTHVVRFGIDPTIPFHPRAWSPGEPLRILMPARFVAKKGTVPALESIARFRLRRPDVPIAVMLVGDGPERDSVVATIARLALGDVVRMVPYWTHDEFVRRLQDYHIVLQHSVTAPDGDHEGGAPVSLLEAQASGALIVATRHADIPEYVRHERSGLLVSEGDVDACAHAIAALVNRASRWPEMGRAGHDHVRARYTVTRQLEHLKEIYLTLAHDRPRSQVPATSTDAEHWGDRLWLGTFFHNRGHAEDAHEVFERIIRLDPDNADARFKRAVSALRTGRVLDADDRSRLVADHVARMDRASALLLAREAAGSPSQHALAHEIVDSLLARRPRDGAALYLKAHLVGLSGRQTDANAIYRQILDSCEDPLFVGGAHFHLGEHLFHAGRRAEARDAYRACLQEIPNHRKAIERLLTLSSLAA